MNAQSRLLPTTLSFVSGFVDAVCFLGLFRTFVAFVTGTITILGGEIVSAGGAETLKLAVIGAFAVSTFLWVAFIRRVVPEAVMLPVVFALEAALLLAFAAAAAAAGPLRGPDAGATIAIALVATVAMSLQNVVMALVLHRHQPSTVMTGNLVRFLVSAVDLAASGRAATADPDAAFKTRSQLLGYVYVLAAFVAGVVLGAAVYDRVGLSAIAVPGVVVALLAVAVRGPGANKRPRGGGQAAAASRAGTRRSERPSSRTQATRRPGPGR